MLRILEKPVATAGLGIACAIALLFALFWAGPFLANYSQTPGAGPDYVSNLSNESAVTSVVNSGAIAAGASSSNYTSGMPPQTATETASASLGSNQLMSSSPTVPSFTFGPVTFASSGERASSMVTFVTLALLSLAVALGSMYFVRRKSANNSQKKSEN